MKKTRRDTQYVIRNTLIFVSFLVLSSCVLRVACCPPVVHAQQPEPWDTTRCAVDGVATLQGFECIFRNIVRILTPIAGLALFITLIVGSFQMLMAGSDPKQVQKAQKTLTSAILGLVVFFGIWFVLKLIQIITGVDVTKFEIPGF